MEKLPIKIILGLLGLFLPVLLLEIGARVMGVEKLSTQERLAIINEHQLNPDDAELWCKPKPGVRKDATKIFAFGGSSVFGCCRTVSLAQAFPAELERRLPPEGNYSVTNYALSGRDSFYHRRCVERLSAAGENAKYWIYYAGHNDYINGRIGDPRISIFLQKNPTLFRATNWFLKSTHLAGALRNFSHPSLAWLDRNTFIKHKELILREYARNVEATHDFVKAAGGKLILITVVSNLEHHPIFREQMNSPSDPTENASRLFALGMAQKKSDPPESLKKLKLARDWDRSAWRAPSEVNQFLRKLAALHPGSIHLIDLEEKIDASFPKEGIGCNFFGEGNHCDHLHPNLRLHREIAEHLKLSILALETGSSK